MADKLISYSELVKSFDDCCGECGCCIHNLPDHSERNTHCVILNSLKAVEPVHSSWCYRSYRSDARITVSGEVVCRKCHALFFRVKGHWFKYCPNCGANMDAKDMDVPTKDGGAD